MRRITILSVALLLLSVNYCLADTIKTIIDNVQFYPVREKMYTQSLNGTWKIKILEGLTVPSDYHAWLTEDFNDELWENVVVPGNWETQRLKRPEYGRDLGEYTGLYRTRFAYNPAWHGKHVILRFDGVHFGYECYVNSHKVGEWGSATNLCQFDITPYLNESKDNVLCVKVNTRPMGWLFDTNDCWSLVGISRDVELFALDNTYLEDVSFTSSVAPDWSSASVTIGVDVARFHETQKDCKLNVSLKDKLNNHILDFVQPIDSKTKTHTFNGEVKSPRLWNAETPNLYTLEVKIVDSKGYVMQRVNERVGIREVRVDGYDLKINHKPVLLHGVCWNEINPKTGKYLTYEERRQQLLMMKEANVNFIRTAHYPFAPDFYRLCDEMGFYVCNEVPFGSRGAAHLRDKDYLPVLITRAEATVRRDKNRPSVIIWSLGNENPYTSIVEEVLKYVKTKDPSRPRGLPQKVGDFMKFSTKPSKNVDVIMGHYLNDTRIDAAIKNTRIPIIQTEYAHSLGLAFGDFESKYARIRKEEKVIGGSVLCWSDQTIMTQGDLQQNAIMKSVRLDSIHYIDCYGKSTADGDKREIWKEAADGIVYGDGYPQEDFYLVRKVYSPVVITTEKLNGHVGKTNSAELTIENRFDFRSLNGYTLNWKVRNIHNVIATGNVQLKSQARQSEKITLQYTLPDKSDICDWMLYAEVEDIEGKVIYETSLPIEIAGHDKDYLSLIESLPQAKNKGIKVSKTKAGMRTNNLSLTIDNHSVLTMKDKDGKELFSSLLLLRVGRPLSITLDYLTQKKKYYWEPYIASPIVEGFEASKTKEGLVTKIQCRWNRGGHDEEYISGVVTITASLNGVVKLDYDLMSSAKATGTLLESGLTLKLSSDFDTFRWLGDGSFSSTPGKTMYNERDCWALHKEDIRFAGNRGNVDIAVVTDDADRGIGLWSDNGNIGIENIDNSIYVSQNAVVCGYGSKFAAPAGRTAANNKKIRGTLTLFVDQPANAVTFLNLLFKPYKPVVSEKPYMESYGR